MDDHYHGVLCDQSLPDELSAPIALPAEGSALATGIQSLRDVNTVLVSTEPVEGGVTANGGYSLGGTKYLVTFVKATTGSTGESRVDLS